MQSTRDCTCQRPLGQQPLFPDWACLHAAFWADPCPLPSAPPGVIQDGQEEQDRSDAGCLRLLLKHPHPLRPLAFFPTAKLLRALSRSLAKEPKR